MLGAINTNSGIFIFHGISLYGYWMLLFPRVDMFRDFGGALPVLHGVHFGEIQSCSICFPYDCISITLYFRCHLLPIDIKQLVLLGLSYDFSADLRHTWIYLACRITRFLLCEGTIRRVQNGITRDCLSQWQKNPIRSVIQRT